MAHIRRDMEGTHWQEVEKMHFGIESDREVVLRGARQLKFSVFINTMFSGYRVGVADVCGLGNKQIPSSPAEYLEYEKKFPQLDSARAYAIELFNRFVTKYGHACVVMHDPFPGRKAG